MEQAGKQLGGFCCCTGFFVPRYMQPPSSPPPPPPPVTEPCAAAALSFEKPGNVKPSPTVVGKEMKIMSALVKSAKSGAFQEGICPNCHPCSKLLGGLEGNAHYIYGSFQALKACALANIPDGGEPSLLFPSGTGCSGRSLMHLYLGAQVGGSCHLILLDKCIPCSTHPTLPEPSWLLFCSLGGGGACGGGGVSVCLAFRLSTEVSEEVQGPWQPRGSGLCPHST